MCGVYQEIVVIALSPECLVFYKEIVVYALSTECVVFYKEIAVIDCCLLNVWRLQRNSCYYLSPECGILQRNIRYYFSPECGVLQRNSCYCSIS